MSSGTGLGRNPWSDDDNDDNDEDDNDDDKITVNFY